MNDNTFIISRTFNAPRELVFKAWTDPEMVKQWWGPEGFTAPYAKVDLQVGGKYVFAMHGPAGSEWDKDMYSAGVYKEIIPNEKLVITDYFSDEQGNMVDPTEQGMDPNFPKESVSTVLFEDEGENKTKVSLIFEKPESEEQWQAMVNSGMEAGWNTSLDKLALAVENK
jgi:uncharacterized protein YndB with AHSA1/START domain